MSPLDCPGASRIVTLAVASAGTIVRGSPERNIVTSSEGSPAFCAKYRSPLAGVSGVPDEKARTRSPGGSPSQEERSTSGIGSTPARSSSRRSPSGPGRTATSARASTWMALWTLPPKIPECMSRSATVTVTRAWMIPRVPTVIAGCAGSRLPESKTMQASAPRSSASIHRITGSLPASSSPSIRKRTWTGSSRASCISQATWINGHMLPLSSDAPRAYRRSSFTVGSNGGVSQSSRGPADCTS